MKKYYFRLDMLKVHCLILLAITVCPTESATKRPGGGNNCGVVTLLYI